MQVKKLIKTNDGVVSFEGEITDDEHSFLLGLGLNTLMEQGAIALTQIESDEEEDEDLDEGSLH